MRPRLQGCLICAGAGRNRAQVGWRKYGCAAQAWPRHSVRTCVAQVPGASVHWYGKREVAAQRKVGHVTIIAPDAASAHRSLAAIDPRAEALLSATLVATAGAYLYALFRVQIVSGLRLMLMYSISVWACTLHQRM